MRIQHNIMAMGAYRNYTNNLSAMKKNLEKLSSGYKINRAGDDAAGLAISEKMRAQITGLETAQKNAKDGISLVQTAEGALTEVHDMLNRMVTLATQSANGTYDNDTDRLQLQKELDQLRSEIDRIADSSNFNGIKLLDGSLSKNGIASISSKFDLPDVGLELGTDTVLHNDEDENAASTAFGLELHNVKFTGKAGDSFTIEIGGSKLTGTLATDMMGEDADHILTGEDMVAGLLGTDTSKVTFTDENGDAIDPEKVVIGDKEYKMVAGSDGDKTHNTTAGEGTSVLFQLNNPETDVNVSMDVKVYANTAEGATNTAKLLSGTATANPVTPSLGGISQKGVSDGKVTVKVINSSGTINTNKIGLVKKDTVDDTNAITAPLMTIVTGKANDIEQTGTKGKYNFTFDSEAIKAAIDKVNHGGSTPPAAGAQIDSGDLQLVMDATAHELQLQDSNGTMIGKVASSALLTAVGGTAAQIVDGTGNVLGTVSVAELNAGDLPNAGAIEGDFTTISNIGLRVATATNPNASTADWDQEKITAEAVLVDAGNGDIKLDFDATKKQIQLKIGEEVIGYADSSKINAGTLTFTGIKSGNTLGKLTLSGNEALNDKNLAAFFKDKGPVDTGLDYKKANVTSTITGAVDHDEMQKAVKAAFKAANKEFTGNEKLSLAYTGNAGHEFNLMLGDVKIGDGTITNGAAAGDPDVLEIKAGATGAGATLFKLNLDEDARDTTGFNLAIDTATVFEDIGPVIAPKENTISTVKTVGMANSEDKTDKLAKLITEAAIKEGVEISDEVELTVSYNDIDKQFELKAGDLLIGTASAANFDPTAGGTAGSSAFATNKLTLKFSDANGATIETSAGAGDMTIEIDGLADDFMPTDLVGSISTNLTFDPDATPAIKADFSGLDQDKVLEFAKDDANKVAAGSKLELVNKGNGTWNLQFNDGTNTVKVESGELSADGTYVDFGDYGIVKFDSPYDATAITDAGAKEILSVGIETGLSVKEQTLDTGITGDFLVTTSDQKNTSQTAGDRLASTTFKLTSDMVKDGASIFVAGKNYTFSTGEDTVIRDGAIKVDISDLDSKSGDYISAVAKRLTDAYAADNTGVYTLGWDGNRVSVTETKTHGNLKSDGSNDDTYPTGDEWDLRTMEGIAKSLGYSSAPTNGKELTLQIGDTAETFNQLKVNINDMHTAAMGVSDDDATSIADISIADQESAAKAVDVIKRAINYVSDVRGTLGATQNRLDHTINNLSVMTENIQDAESTIRDTDVAEEMMAYTKNNILIQSAQAMLAQANQVPQGVLQLLQ